MGVVPYVCTTRQKDSTYMIIWWLHIAYITHIQNHIESILEGKVYYKESFHYQPECNCVCRYGYFINGSTHGDETWFTRALLTYRVLNEVNDGSVKLSGPG